MTLLTSTHALPLNATEVAGPMLAGELPCTCCGDLVYRGRLALQAGLCGTCYSSREADRAHGRREPEHWEAECPAECMAYILDDDGEPLACYHLLTHAARLAEQAHYYASARTPRAGSAEASAATTTLEGIMPSKTLTPAQKAAAKITRRATAARRATERDTYTCGNCGSRGLVAGEPHTCESAGEALAAANGDGSIAEAAQAQAEDDDTYPCPVAGCTATLSGNGSDHDCPVLAAAYSASPPTPIRRSRAQKDAEQERAANRIEREAAAEVKQLARQRKAAEREQAQQARLNARQAAASQPKAPKAPKAAATPAGDPDAAQLGRYQRERLAARAAAAAIGAGTLSLVGAIKTDKNRWHAELSDGAVACGSKPGKELVRDESRAAVNCPPCMLTVKLLG